MTIVEIEGIIDTLRSRHKNLTEDLFVTLLTAGGWENKIIKEAKALFGASAFAVEERWKKKEKDGMVLKNEIQKQGKDENQRDFKITQREEESLVVKINGHTFIQQEILSAVETVEINNKNFSEKKEIIFLENKKKKEGRLDKEEKSLLYLTVTMLLIIILLLSYMYIHDR